MIDRDNGISMAALRPFMQTKKTVKKEEPKSKEWNVEVRGLSDLLAAA